MWEKFTRFGYSNSCGKAEGQKLSTQRHGEALDGDNIKTSGEKMYPATNFVRDASYGVDENWIHVPVRSVRFSHRERC